RSRRARGGCARSVATRLQPAGRPVEYRRAPRGRRAGARAPGRPRHRRHLQLQRLGATDPRIPGVGPPSRLRPRFVRGGIRKAGSTDLPRRARAGARDGGGGDLRRRSLLDRRAGREGRRPARGPPRSRRLLGRPRLSDRARRPGGGQARGLYITLPPGETRFTRPAHTLFDGSSPHPDWKGAGAMSDTTPTSQPPTSGGDKPRRRFLWSAAIATVIAALAAA